MQQQGYHLSNFRVASWIVFGNDTLYNTILRHWYIIRITCHSYLCSITRNTTGSYKENKTNILKRYKQLLSDSKVSLSYFAYFVFQTGNFATFSFFGVWLSIQFGLQIHEIGTAMLVLD